MPGRRHGEIRESESEIKERIKQSADGQDRVRLRFLYEMQSHPEMPLNELAQRLGYSERQVRRWWSEYRNGGLSLLLTHDDAVPVEPGVTASDDTAARLLHFINHLPM